MEGITAKSVQSMACLMMTLWSGFMFTRSVNAGSRYTAAADYQDSRWDGYEYYLCTDENTNQAAAAAANDDFGTDIVVSCCSYDGTFGVRPDCDAYPVTYSQAQAVCADNGYRLCTLQELLWDRLTNGEGCSFDRGYNWVSDECEPSPTKEPSSDPTLSPSLTPSTVPTSSPSQSPSAVPTGVPTGDPTTVPTIDPTIDPTSDPTNDPIMNPSPSPSRAPTLSPSLTPSSAPSEAPTVAPSQFPSAVPTSSPTNEPTEDPTTDPTMEPTSVPTDNPSNAPTCHPIQYADFEYDAMASFSITGWTYAQLSTANNDIDLFISSLTESIHKGFDNDANLEYRDIVLNATSINEHPLDDSETGDILGESIDGGMELEYLIECSNSVRLHYILDDDPSVGFNRTALEFSVSDDLNAFFAAINTNEDNSALVFIVDDMALETVTEEMTSDSFTLSIDMLIGGCAVVLSVALFICIRYWCRKTNDSKTPMSTKEGHYPQTIPVKVDTSEAPGIEQVSSLNLPVLPEESDTLDRTQTTTSDMYMDREHDVIDVHGMVTKAGGSGSSIFMGHIVVSARGKSPSQKEGAPKDGNETHYR